jgi:hypothetical protein
MAKDMGSYRDSQTLSWLSGPQTMYRLNPPPLIGPDSKDGSVFALFNLIKFPFSILQSTYKYISECEENVFLVSNKIC